MLILSEDRFETDNMVLAAFLEYHGVSLEARCVDVRGRKSVMWSYDFGQDGDGEKLVDLVDSFEDGSGRVEPQQFNKVFGAVRGEVYELTNYKPKRTDHHRRRAS